MHCVQLSQSQFKARGWVLRWTGCPAARLGFAVAWLAGWVLWWPGWVLRWPGPTGFCGGGGPAEFLDQAN